MSNWIWAAAETTLGLLRSSHSSPQDNLRQYAQLAILPEMVLPPEAPSPPPPGSKSHKNKIVVQHGSFRHLECMHVIKHFDQLAIEFNQLNMPNTARQDAEGADDVGITVPAPGYNIPARVVRRPADVHRLFNWVMDYPLQTICRIMHLVYPETASYIIQEDVAAGGRSNDLIRWVKWAPDVTLIRGASDLLKPTVTVFVQAPWILSQRDLEVFTACRTFPIARERWIEPLTGSKRLWAKVWDTCVQNRSHWFVVTTYWGWVFGAFSEERTQAWTSNVVSWDSQSPTIIEYLFFWFACATVQKKRVSGAWTIPEVPEPIDAYDSDPDVEDQPEEEADNFMDIASSVSDDWEARSDARSHSPSADMSDDDDATVMLEMTGEVNHRRRQRETLHSAAFHEWRSNVQAKTTQHPVGPYTLGPRAPSVASSETTNSSFSTVHNYLQDEKLAGSWLRGHPLGIGRY